MTTEHVRLTIDKAFEELALVLDGIFVVHNVEDEVIWQVMKHLDMIHTNLSDKLEGIGRRPDYENASREPHETHPAVEALLAKLQKRNSQREAEL